MAIRVMLIGRNNKIVTSMSECNRVKREENEKQNVKKLIKYSISFPSQLNSFS